ncbi:hypothetical protein J5N97_018109 [Dioscorea zingiberensis]|uniref:Uncharacterized protein n=1 Tax=Dioscorea zingiberensis TaxID=325984 RepID=A0A9D5HGZ0_9LILI|nr:hypothetical protein J5N97_018109 [Dioscorea zingiberensis]
MSVYRYLHAQPVAAAAAAAAAAMVLEILELSTLSCLSVMPLESDGSLCLMEALSRSHQEGLMGATQSPKLEDFLGSGPDPSLCEQ